MQKPFQIIPDPPTLENIKGLFHSDYYNFPKWYLNTVLMTGITIIIKIVPYHIYGIWFFQKIKIQGQRCYIPCFACGNDDTGRYL